MACSLKDRKNDEIQEEEEENVWDKLIVYHICINLELKYF